MDSNHRTLGGQIYSLVDLTTLPPLHIGCSQGSKSPRETCTAAEAAEGRRAL